MQRRVEQADRHRQARHRLEDPLEVGLLERQQPVERARGARPRRRRGSSPARPAAAPRRRTCARCGRGRCPRRRTRAPSPRPRACPRSRAPSGGARSSAQPRIVSKSSLICGGTSGTSPTITRPGAAVDRDHVALVQLVAADPHRRRVDVDLEPLAAGDARLAHAARDDGRVRGHAAVRGEHALRAGSCPWMSSGVVSQRTRMTASPRLAALRRGVGVEHDRAARGARRRVQARAPRPRTRRSGRASGAAAGRAAPGRCARPPPRA